MRLILCTVSLVTGSIRTQSKDTNGETDLRDVILLDLFDSSEEDNFLKDSNETLGPPLSPDDFRSEYFISDLKDQDLLQVSRELGGGEV